jgi:hypothetical protein
MVADHDYNIPNILSLEKLKMSVDLISFDITFLRYNQIVKERHFAKMQSG